jgi:hypothetical protein
VCQNIIDFDTVAYECGWFGWGQGNDPYTVYVCDRDRCGQHTIYVAAEADHDPDYYLLRCAEVRACCNRPTATANPGSSHVDLPI